MLGKRIIPLARHNATRMAEIASLGDDYPGPVQMVAFSPDGALLACSTYDQLYVWDVAQRQPVFDRQMPAHSLAFSPDSSTLVAAGHDIIFLDARTGQQQAMLKGHPQGTTCVAFSPDGALLASGGMDGVVRIGSLTTRRLVSKLDHPAPVRGLAFSPDGARLATASWGSGDEPKQIILWDAASSEQQLSLPCTKEKNLCFSPDGARLAVDGKIFDLAEQRVIHDFSERQAVFSPDGHIIATCHNSFTTVGLWDAHSGEKLHVLRGHGEPVWHIAFNAAGTLLASGGGAMSAGALLRGEAEEARTDNSMRLWGVPEPVSKPLRPGTRPLKELGKADSHRDRHESTPLKPVQGLLDRLSR